MPNDKMKVITVMSRKGGAGKTTLLQALLSAAIKDGKRCLALDADPQQALTRWFERAEINNPLVRCAQLEVSSDLEKWTDEAWEKGETDIVFVDTQGAAGAWADDLAAFSDVLIVPMKLGDTDLTITTDTFNWYCGLRERTDDPENLPSFKVVLADVPNKLTASQKYIEEVALTRFPIMEDYFMHRNQHIDADRSGFLHDLADFRRAHKYGLFRSHAKLFDEAVEEATAILTEAMGET
ncbi:AAA family ATPase [Sulfitobacter sp.]|jgi:chromosome partitioning protein|uniref:AAA family ATPase n=1 Tax=Sulfitobacter sp. TaxID=1903071 RepID=UPI003002A439